MKQAIKARRISRVGVFIAGIGLAISFFAHPPSAFGRPRKQGANVTVFRGAEVLKGELIGIRADALVIKSEKSENAIPLAEIDKIRVSRGLNQTGGVIGAVAGGIAGIVVANSLKPKELYANTLNDWAAAVVTESMMSLVRPCVGFSVGTLAGGLLGAAVGTAVTKDEVIQLRDRSGADIDAALKNLRKKARVPDYR